MLLSGVLFDLDQTLINSQKAEYLRKRKNWNQVYQIIPDLRPYTGITKLLNYLNDNNILIAIVTSSPSHYCHKIVDYWGWKIDVVVGYHDTKLHKPKPDPILEGCRRLNLPPEQLISIGDSSKDIYATKAANIYSVAATWGSTEIEDLYESKPNYICHSPEQLKELITEFLDKPMIFNQQSNSGNLSQIYYLYNYYPTHYNRNDEYSKKILELKKNKFNAVEFWHNEIQNLFKGEFAITIVPSHSASKNNRNSGISQVAKKLIEDNPIERTDLIDTLNRFSDIQKLSKGGNREIQNHLNSIEVKDDLTQSEPILLLDDVTTTGNSLLACKELLEKAGATHVICLALTRTVGGSSDQFTQIDNSKQPINFDKINKFKEANYYDQEDEVDREIADLNEAIRLNPNDADTYKNRGNVYYDQGNLKQAIKDYTQAIYLKPRDTKALLIRGSLYFIRNDYENANSDFSGVIELGSDNQKNLLIGAYYFRAIAYEKQGKLENSLADLTEAINLHPEEDELYKNKGIIRRDELYKKRGIIRRNLGDLEGAFSDYTKAINLNPYEASYYNNRGWIYGKKGKHKSAIKDLEIAKSLNKSTNSDDSNPLYSLDTTITQNLILSYQPLSILEDTLSIAYKRRDETTKFYNLEKLLDTCNKLIENNMANANTYFYKGKVLVEKQYFEEAIYYFETCLDLLSTDSNKINNYLVEGMISICKADFQEAINKFNQSIAISPNNYDTYFNIALAKYMKEVASFENRLAFGGDPTDAFFTKEEKEKIISNLNQVIYAYPHDSEAYHYRGITYIDIGQTQLGINDLKLSIYFDPNNTKSYLRLGNILNIFYEEKEESLDQYNQAIKIDPYYGAAYKQRGKTHQELGNLAQAINDLQTAANCYLKIYQNKTYRKEQLIEYQEVIKNISKILSEEENLDQYNQAIKIDSSHAFAYKQRGETNKQLGNLAKAINDFQIAADYYLKIYQNQNYSKEQLYKYREIINNISDTLSQCDIHILEQINSK